MKNALYVLIGLMAGFVLAAILLIVTRLPGGQPVTLEPAPTQAPVVIQIIGEVVKPGVYSLPDGSRVQDAVNAAGGLLADADENSINLAARLEDGQQIKIPAQGGNSGFNNSGFAPIPTSAPFIVVSTLSPTSVSSSSLVNINTATLQQLDTLPGIGPVTAQNIVTYRQQHGLFQHIEDIMNVSGIGPATFNNIQNLITVGP
ncbi:MAG TPA: helix-hairpin-helix domain-containing protein [Anaerolineales bacterium]